MQESSSPVSHFLREYERLGDRVNRCLREYLGDPGTAQTQNLRASVRRLEAAIRLLPKRARNEKAIRRCRKRCRELLKETSRVRDIDMLSQSIAAKGDDPTVTLILNNLREERDEFVDNSTRAAWKLFERHPPKLGKGDLSGFTRRVQTVFRDLEAEIAFELHASLTDESKVRELHALRKDCKRLRYSLEFFPTGHGENETVTLLKKWQDVLGEIRDMDVRIAYLSGAKRTRGVREILAAERTRRHSRYIAFVKLCVASPQPLALPRPWRGTEKAATPR